MLWLLPAKTLLKETWSSANFGGTQLSKTKVKPFIGSSLPIYRSIDLYFSLISVKIRQQITRGGRHQDTRRQLFKTKERIRFSTTISKTTMSCHEIYQTYFHCLCFVFLHCNFLYATNIILRIRCSNHPYIDQPDTKK